MSSRLSNLAMLARPSITAWSARKYDKTVTEEVKTAHNAHGDVGRFHKVLVAEERLKKIRSAANDFRTAHYHLTAPWLDDGSRLLPARLYERYTRLEREAHALWSQEVSAFLFEYPSLKADAALTLGTLYNEQDYPTEETVRAAFSWDVHYYPVPDSTDWRVDLGEGELANLRQEVSKAERAAVILATSDATQRLYQAVQAMAERLADPDAIFRDSLVANIAELCEIIPSLNLADDPTLNALAAEAKATLTARTPDKLRKEPDARADTAKAAADIASRVKGIF